MNNIIQIVLGFILADLIVGFFHWFEDSYLDYCIDFPILGQISKDNELHHYFPRSIIAYNYFEHVSVTIPIIVIIFSILYLINKNIFTYKYKYFFISFAFFCTVSNIIHRYSHMRQCETNIILQFLQYTGIFCSHEHHSSHHVNPTQKYCVISEYNNYILDNINFWRGMENMVYILTNIKPNRKQAYDSYSPIHNHMHKNAKLVCPDKPTREDVEMLIKKLDDYKKCKNR